MEVVKVERSVARGRVSLAELLARARSLQLQVASCNLQSAISSLQARGHHCGPAGCDALGARLARLARLARRSLPAGRILHLLRSAHSSCAHSCAHLKFARGCAVARPLGGRRGAPAHLMQHFYCPLVSHPQHTVQTHSNARRQDHMSPVLSHQVTVWAYIRAQLARVSAAAAAAAAAAVWANVWAKVVRSLGCNFSAAEWPGRGTGAKAPTGGGLYGRRRLAGPWRSAAYTCRPQELARQQAQLAAVFCEITCRFRRRCFAKSPPWTP